MFQIENLEGRRMMSVTAPVNGVLTITGTPNADTIVVSQQDAATIRVQDTDGSVQFFAGSSVTRIVVNAGAGNDTVRLTNTNERSTLNGEAGDDRLEGGPSADVINGGDNNDVMMGFDGADELDGGAGNDTFDGGLGPDTAVYTSRTRGVGVSLDDVANDGDSFGAPLIAPERDNVRSSIETVFGGQGGDLLVGNAARNQLVGNGGADVIRGLGGDDVLRGGDANDRVLGGQGADTISGDAGDDVLTGGAGIDTIRGGAGNDTIFGGGAVDSLFGDDGNDILFSEGDSAADTVNGGTGSDLADADANDIITSVELLA
jgi:Ca2+-binding RTX toxin-like protein